MLRPEARERENRRRSGSARARRACGEEVQRGRRAARRDLRDQDRVGLLHRIFIGRHRRQMVRASTLTSMSTLLMMSFTL